MRSENAVLQNTGAPIGCVSRGGRVLVTWNMQGWKLTAPPRNGAGRHYVPCSWCGKLQAVPMNVVSCHCDNTCAAELGYEQVPGGERPCSDPDAEVNLSSSDDFRPQIDFVNHRGE